MTANLIFNTQNLMFTGGKYSQDCGLIDFTSETYTIEVWFKSKMAKGTAGTFLSATAGDLHGILLEVEKTGKLRYLHREKLGVSNGLNLYSQKIVTDGELHHLAVVMSTTEMAMYLDGKLEVSGEKAKAPFSQKLHVILGQLLSNNFTRPFKGEIIKLHIWDQARTEDELSVDRYIFDVKDLNGSQPRLLKLMKADRDRGNRVEYEIDIRSGIKEIWNMFRTAIEGCHVQGIGRYRDNIYIALSQEEEGQLYIHNGKEKKVYKTSLNTTKGKSKEEGHPSSLQISGNYLIVTVEGDYGTREKLPEALHERQYGSEMQIYSLLSDPNTPKLICRIRQDNVNSGGAGLAYHTGINRWFVLAEKDPKNGASTMCLYKSDSETLSDKSTWETIPTGWDSLGTGAGTCLISASDHSIWALYFEHNERDSKYYDVVKLYQVLDSNGDLVQSRDVKSEEVDSVGVQTDLITDGPPSMRWGASLSIVDMKPYLYVAERNIGLDFLYDEVTIATPPRIHLSISNLALTCTGLGDEGSYLEIYKFSLAALAVHPNGEVDTISLFSFKSADQNNKSHRWDMKKNEQKKLTASSGLNINADDEVTFSARAYEDDPWHDPDDVLQMTNSSDITLTGSDFLSKSSDTGKLPYTIKLKDGKQEMEVTFDVQVTTSTP